MRPFRSLCLATLLATTAGCAVGVDAARTSGPSAVRVRTLHAVPTQQAPTVTLTGVLVADLQVALRPEASGVVQAVHFRDGQEVRRGDALLSLRDAAQRAGLAEADAALKLAEAEVARIEPLAARDRISASTLDAARADLALARARRDAAAEQLRRTVLRAPFDGYLGTRDVAPGDTVDPARVVTTLVDVDPLRAQVDVPERLARWLRPELPAQVTVDALPGDPIPAVVDFVGAAITESTRTVRVRVRLEAPPPAVRPGMTAVTTLQLEPPEPVLTVPAEALLTRADGTFVWVVHEGRAALRPVDVGQRLAASVVVRRGLEAGDEVVVQGIARLRDGIEVEILGTLPSADTQPKVR